MELNEGLSPNELAAMEGEDETNDDALLSAVVGEEEEAEPGEKETETDGKPAAAAAETPAAQKEPGVEAGGETPTGESAFVLPELDEIVVPAGIPAVSFQFRDDGKILPAFQGSFQELDAKYDAGELPLSQYNEQRDALRAQMSNEKADAQLWTAECETFWRHNKDWRSGTPLGDMLNGEVMRLAASEKSAGLTGIEIIYAAKERVSKAIASVRPDKAASKAELPAGAKRPASPRPAPATHALGAAPAAAPADVGGGEFTHLDNLQGLDLEAAVAGMTADQRDRWTRES
jgi:hypothetical protein